MPKYTFKCEKCGSEKQQYASRSSDSVPCTECDVSMKRCLPTLSGQPDITEIVNDYTGQTAKQDQSTMIKERRDKYYWSVEVPRLVASGTYGVDTMLELGWVWFDDKGHMQVNTKPPHER